MQLDLNNYNSKSSIELENLSPQKQASRKALIQFPETEDMQEKNLYLVNLGLLQEYHQKVKIELARRSLSR